MIYTNVSKSFCYHRPLTPSYNSLNSLTPTGTFCNNNCFWGVYKHKHTETVKPAIKQGQIQVLWGLKLMQLLGPPLRKKIQNYEYKMRHKNEYLFRRRKEITTNHKLKKKNTTNITKSRKNLILLLTA
jgi:hypothetical protein